MQTKPCNPSWKGVPGNSVGEAGDAPPVMVAVGVEVAVGSVLVVGEELAVASGQPEGMHTCTRVTRIDSAMT